MNQDATSASEGGNTITPSKQYRRFCFTLNNPVEDEVRHLRMTFAIKGAKWIMGNEVGEEGTPHIQGYAVLKNGVRLSTLKNWNGRMHIERAIGSTKQNIAYCSKDGDFESTFPLDLSQRLMKMYDGCEWLPWQKEIIDIIESQREERTIHWFWEPNGNIGKSFLCKYVFLKYNAILCGGKTADVFNQVLKWMEEHEGESPQVVMCDVPRTHIEYVSYQALEALKNGLLYSGKYEGGACAFEPPHVVCLANEPPKFEKMSKDRWHVVSLYDSSKCELIEDEDV